LRTVIAETLKKIGYTYSNITYDPSWIKLAIIGRPNVGKSSIINAIMGENRVMVRDMPGTTRDSIDSVFRTDE
jgi:GTP-binding protein